MRARDIGLALTAGIAAFLLVGVLVTELAAARIEFSLFLGIPVGLVAGIATAAFVIVRLGNPDPAKRRVAQASGGFGVVFIGVLRLLAGGLSVRNSLALPIAAVAAVVGALITYASLGATGSSPDESPYS